MYISNTVSKLGSAISCINLTPGVTCNPEAPCAKCGKCYAMKGRFRFSNVIKSMKRNLDEYKNNDFLFFLNIINHCIVNKSRYFRWHSSGDIPDQKYLNGMVATATMCKDTRFLCFTKKYDLVNSYLDENPKFPENLVVVFSAWGEFIPNNPHDLPVAYVNLKSGEGNVHIPHNALPCSGFCGECVNQKANCWNLGSGESVVFNEH